MDVLERRVAALEAKMDDVRERLARIDEWRQEERRNHMWSMRIQFSVLILVILEIIRPLVMR